MFKSYKFYATSVAIALVALLFFFESQEQKSNLPLIAIANYGPHSSLQQSIDGLKDELTKLGYIEGETIRYEIANVNFETSLIIQMITKLKASRPKIFVAISTPIAQSAKNMIRDIPVVYVNITDPDEAGLVSKDPNSNVTGASDKQDLSVMLGFAKKLLPQAKKVGILYSTGEANDLSLVKMLTASAKKVGIDVVAVPVEHTRDVVTRMKVFKSNVDFIYAGSSGAIQASLPAIVSTAESMKLPLFNFNGEEVMSHNALASFGVSYRQIGANAAGIIHKIFGGQKAGSIKPVYPSISDYEGFISKKRSDKIGLVIPDNLSQVTIVE